MKMGTVLVPETSEYIHILTRLAARENFIEFCRRQSFKIYYPLFLSDFRKNVF